MDAKKNRGEKGSSRNHDSLNTVDSTVLVRRDEIECSWSAADQGGTDCHLSFIPLAKKKQK